MISGKLKSDPAETFPDLREEEESGAEDAAKEDEDSTASSESSDESSEGDDYPLPEDSSVKDRTKRELVRLRKAMVEDSPFEAYYDGWFKLL